MLKFDNKGVQKCTVFFLERNLLLLSILTIFDKILSNQINLIDPNFKNYKNIDL